MLNAERRIRSEGSDIQFIRLFILKYRTFCIGFQNKQPSYFALPIFLLLLPSSSFSYLLLLLLLLLPLPSSSSSSSSSFSLILSPSLLSVLLDCSTVFLSTQIQFWADRQAVELKIAFAFKSESTTNEEENTWVR